MKENDYFTNSFNEVTPLTPLVFDPLHAFKKKLQKKDLKIVSESIKMIPKPNTKSPNKRSAKDHDYHLTKSAYQTNGFNKDRTHDPSQGNENSKVGGKFFDEHQFGKKITKNNSKNRSKFKSKQSKSKSQSKKRGKKHSNQLSFVKETSKAGQNRMAKVKSSLNHLSTKRERIQSLLNGRKDLVGDTRAGKFDPKKRRDTLKVERNSS
jgi:hypothetical protein